MNKSCQTHDECVYTEDMTTTPKYTTKFLADLLRATEPCKRCDGMFNPEDGFTNAYGSFVCEECSHTDNKLK
jgi:hypothetical protein